jgi:hypothetical protein
LTAGTVSRVSRLGGSVRVIAASQNLPKGIATDGNNVYWVRIPEPPGRRFRRHLGTDSGMTRARIPGASGR